VLTSEPVPPPRTQRKISWDVLRVVAITAVVVQHITHQAPINHPELGPYPVTVPVQFGASTLLVISAYFVCVTVRRGNTRKWLGSRLARILPAYVVAVVVTYVASRSIAATFEHPSWFVPDAPDLVSNLLMIEAWSPHFHWVDASYWTLPIQVTGFIAAAVLAPRRWLRGHNLSVLLWAVVVVPVIIRFGWRHDDAAQWIKSAFDGLSLHRVALFGAGVAIYLWTRERMTTGHLAAYLLAVLAAQDAHSYFVDTASTVALGVAIFGVVLAAGGPDWNAPILRRAAPVITWLAGISYGVYLVHQELGFIAARVLLDRGVAPWERFAVCVTLAIVLGWLLTRLVEKPAHRWLTTSLPRLLAQPHAGRTGMGPVRPSPVLRPASHATMSVIDPLISAELAAPGTTSRQFR
jgi:peptidoglycan/LPS O-acetylase OafA/YrhL